ncbi:MULTISPECIES: hypothetical protein [Actinokineospora]|uniref:Uncharacterized protein n=1 Tax=Actinokineospora fastidiosa TaxID=1816 RepID=A0A918GFK7_9PSEU|nr:MULTISPECIES: hypothetical protein [Actinokineospora]UVS80089.1 hypothetical protein Actkin_03839 [Actinokineospora sp. UTMC 2448]GGS32974.1 hypothetical protein GCM10010171_28840 [Actinokineospora fastidiosa]
MTASEPQPATAHDAPTVRIRLAGTLPTPRPTPQKSMARRIARKILGPNLLTKRD